MGEEKKENIFSQERQLLHEQLKLLAEQSGKCSAENLAALSEQMVAIYSVLHSPNF